MNVPECVHISLLPEPLLQQTREALSMVSTAASPHLQAWGSAGGSGQSGAGGRAPASEPPRPRRAGPLLLPMASAAWQGCGGLLCQRFLGIRWLAPSPGAGSSCSPEAAFLAASAFPEPAGPASACPGQRRQTKAGSLGLGPGGRGAELCYMPEPPRGTRFPGCDKDVGLERQPPSCPWAAASIQPRGARDTARGRSDGWWLVAAAQPCRF